MAETLPPQILWAQRNDKVFVSIQLDDVSDENITVNTEKLTFSGKSRNKNYAVDLEFNGSIIPEESKQRKGGREYFFELKKKEEGPYWPRLLKDNKKRQYLKIDFNRWKDEDESDDETAAGGGPGYDDANLESMMAQMGGGMGGMGGMPGMGGMGGMPGMGGMGGMGGAPSFDPDDDEISDDSDDDDIPELESDIATDKKE